MKHNKHDINLHIKYLQPFAVVNNVTEIDNLTCEQKPLPLLNFMYTCVCIS